jgi:ribosomal protein S4
LYEQYVSNNNININNKKIIEPSLSLIKSDIRKHINYDSNRNYSSKISISNSNKRFFSTRSPIVTNYNHYNVVNNISSLMNSRISVSGNFSFFK